jgi:hypothetical protein
LAPIFPGSPDKAQDADYDKIDGNDETEQPREDEDQDTRYQGDQGL